MAATPATLPVLKSIEDFIEGSYDYIVVGGGNAGSLSQYANLNKAVTNTVQDLLLLAVYQRTQASALL